MSVCVCLYNIHVHMNKYIMCSVHLYIYYILSTNIHYIHIHRAHTFTERTDVEGNSCCVLIYFESSKGRECLFTCTCTWHTCTQMYMHVHVHLCTYTQTNDVCFAYLAVSFELLFLFFEILVHCH